MPGYRASWLNNRHPLPDHISTLERKKYVSVFAKIWAFMANGLTEIDLVRCWVAWRVLPLSIRPGLMCEYTGELTDPQHHCEIEITEEDIKNMTKTLLNESLEDCSQFGLSPFCTLNEPPAVSFEPSSYLIHIFIFCCLLVPIHCLQADSPFWTKKLPEKPKKTGGRTKQQKKGKKATAKRGGGLGDASGAPGF